MHSPVTEKRVDVLQSWAMKATSPESSAVHSRMVSVYCLLMRAIIIRESSFSLSPFLVQYASSTGFSSSTQKITVSLTGTTVLLGSFLVMLPESAEKNHMKNIFCVAPGYSSSFWPPIFRIELIPSTVSSATVRLPSFISQMYTASSLVVTL